MTDSLSVDFAQQRALRDAANGAPVPAEAQADLKFYFSKTMTADAITNWCAELAQVLVTPVRFAAGGAPDRQDMNGARFQVNVKLPEKPGLMPGKVAESESFRAFARKQVAFAARSIVALANKVEKIEFRDGDPEQVASNSFTVEKKPPEAATPVIRLSFARQIETAALHLVAILGRDNNRDLTQTIDQFSKLVKKAVDRAGDADEVNLSMEEKQELYKLAQKIQLTQMHLLGFQRVFSIAAHCLDGWNPLHDPEKPERSPWTVKPGP